MTDPTPPVATTALPTMLREAIALRRQNDFAGAANIFRGVLAIDPRNFDALHLFGMLAADAGDATTAVERITAAIRINGTQAAAHYNLGNALRMLGRHEEAIASYERAIALKPDYARAFNNRANSLFDLKRYAEAVEGYGRATAIEPGFADAWHNRGHALNELKRFDEAIESYRQALAAGGDAARLEFELAALGAGTMPATAPENFVARLFDGYADNFDEHLVGKLKYETPAAAVSAVRQVTQAIDLDVLDLGCGTGLCGPLLRPFARSLAGVDLSQKMLDKARERKLYDELVCDDVVRTLENRPAAFDLVIATDVFVYIGDLEAVFAGAARALKAGGLFAFSVERSASKDFVLQQSRRYAHSEAYLQRLATVHGYAIKHLEQRFLRKDDDTDIAGLIVVMRVI